MTRPDTTRTGRYAIAWKGSVRRAGRWRVPDRYTTVVYKGGGTLDLRAAELLSPVTTIVAVAYKSTISLLVPPGVRVEMTGFGVTQGPTDDIALAPDAPVLHIRGIAYKGSIETSSRPGAGGPAGPSGAVDAVDAVGAASAVLSRRPRVDGPGPQRRVALVLLDRVRDPAGRAGDREHGLAGPRGHPRDLGEHGEREVDVRSGQALAGHFGQYRLGHGQPPVARRGGPHEIEQQHRPRVSGAVDEVTETRHPLAAAAARHG